MTPRSTKGWRVLNRIRRETGTRYLQSEFVQLLYLLTTWVHKLSRYHEREALNMMSRIKKSFAKVFLGVVRWGFVDVRKVIYDKRPR